MAATPTDLDGLNDKYMLLAASGFAGIGLVYFVCIVPAWLSWLASDRSGQGWLLKGHSNPASKFEARRFAKPPPPKSVMGIVAHGRTLYNT
jgi:hypothetical protein